MIFYSIFQFFYRQLYKVIVYRDLFIIFIFLHFFFISVFWWISLNDQILDYEIWSLITIWLCLVSSKYNAFHHITFISFAYAFYQDSAYFIEMFSEIIVYLVRIHFIHLLTFKQFSPYKFWIISYGCIYIIMQKSVQMIKS